MMNASPAPQEIFLLKLGEVVLKGQNRQSFEDKLLANVRRRVKNCGSFQCSLRQSTIYVEPQSGDCDMEAAWTACRQVFGIAAVARAVPCEKTVPPLWRPPEPIWPMPLPPQRVLRWRASGRTRRIP